MVLYDSVNYQMQGAHAQVSVVILYFVTDIMIIIVNSKDQ